MLVHTFSLLNQSEEFATNENILGTYITGDLRYYIIGFITLLVIL